MDDLERIKLSRKATDQKNISLIKILHSTLDSIYEEIGCYSDCNNCVLGEMKEDLCVGADIGILKTKINRKIEEYEEEINNV